MVTAARTARRPRTRSRNARSDTRPGDEAVRRAVSEIASRHPAVGLAIGIVRDGQLAGAAGHGLADLRSRRPVDERTAFRIASVTKLFTAVAVMQLVERGRFDLDTPVRDVLTAYRVVPARGVEGTPTIRHLLTHTSGIPEVVRIGDLLHPSWGSFGSRPAVHSVPIGQPVPSLADVYRGRLRFVTPPGRAFTYSNHGFATLGQVVEDASGLSLDRYLDEHVLGPLGMADTALGRTDRTEARRATGYDIGPRGPVAVVDREWVSRGASAITSTIDDLARFATALLPGGGGPRILAPASLATMMAAHWQPHPAVGGMGLGCFRGEIGGHRTVWHDGRVPGFTAMLLLAPDDDVAVIGLTNGAPHAPYWLPTELEHLLGTEIGAAPAGLRVDLPHRPETWAPIVGRYGLTERVSDPRARLMLGGGMEVLVRDGRLVARLRLPAPTLWRGVPLHPDDAEDPWVFRADLAPLGLGTTRLAFTGAAVHADLGCLSLDRLPPSAGRTWRVAALGAAGGAAATLLRSRKRRRR